MLQEIAGRNPDHVHSHNPADHHLLLLQLLQALLLRGHRGGQPHRDVGPGHHVHLSVGESSENLLYQDDRCLAGVCSSHPILRGGSLLSYV